MFRRIINRFQSIPLNVTSMNNEELRSGRMRNSIKGYLCYTAVPACFTGGVLTYFASYVIGFGLALGAAGSDLPEKDSMRIVNVVHNGMKFGGILIFGSLAIFSGVKAFRFFQQARLCHRELNTRFDKLTIQK